MYQSKYKGVLFIEGMVENFQKIEPISVSIDGWGLTQAQLKTLDDVKDLMVQRAKEAGGDTIANFKYGQKSVGFWKSIFSLDEVAWYGEGVLGRLST